MVNGARFTDQQLRADLAEGLSKAEIARKYGVSRPAVSKRVNRLELTTAAATHAPGESRRYAKANLDVMEELAGSLSRVNLLLDACDDWLRDADEPDRYDIGPRADEIDVTYLVQVCCGEDKQGRPKFRTEKRKALLSTLIDRAKDPRGDPIIGTEGCESKHADPRELILSTAAEVRKTVGSLTDIARLLTDVRSMEVLREAILLELGKADPDIARRCAEAVRRSLVLNTALGGPAALPAGRGEAN